MAKNETGIAFRAPSDLYDRFKEAAEADHRSVKGAFLHFMEQRVAEHEADRTDSKAASKAVA